MIALSKYSKKARLNDYLHLAKKGKIEGSQTIIKTTVTYFTTQYTTVTYNHFCGSIRRLRCVHETEQLEKYIVLSLFVQALGATAVGETL